MYKIQIDYHTGDSFGSHDETDTLEFKFHNADIAEGNCLRIVEHYRHYEEMQYDSYEDRVAKYGGKRWFKKAKDKKHMSDYDALYSLILLTDAGEPFVYSASQWCGYFEGLHSVETILDTVKYEV